jgi:DNA-binding NtrC family response regulator
MRRILIVDDDEDLLSVLKSELEADFDSKQIEVFVESSPSKAIEKVKEVFFDIAVCDLKLPEIDGIELTKMIKSISPDTTVIIMTAFPSLESVLKALKLHVYDFIVKPFHIDEFKFTLKKALELLDLKNGYRILKISDYEYGDIVFRSKKMEEVINLSKDLAKIDVDVLITGETGVGKELIARYIHKLSGREKFVALNCAAIPPDLFEAELFGYEKGAFTGAISSRVGIAEWASGGTLFLDEIAEMPYQMQAKFLRFLQDKTIRRLGGNKEIKVNVRIIFATNRNIEKDVKEGRFREDLWWRISAFRINIPPLRERKEDIEELINYFLEKYSRELNKEKIRIDDEALEILKNYNWPGNVRELQNLIKKLVVFSKKNIITADDLPDGIVFSEPVSSDASSPDFPNSFFELRKKTIEDFERDYIKKLIEKTDGDLEKASQLSGIPRSTLYRLIKKIRN